MLEIKVFTPPNMTQLSLYSYENYLEKGEGLIFITPDDNVANGFTYEYIAGEKAHEMAADQLTEYKPKDEILFVVKQPDDSLGYVIQRFREMTARPSYLHMVKETVTGSGQAPQD